MRILALALVLPQPGKAHGRPQLQRLCLLVAGNSEGLLETRLRLVCIRDNLPQQQLAFESMLLHLVTMFPSFIRSDERLSQRRQPFLYVSSLYVRCSQSGQKKWLPCLRPGGAVRGQAVMHLRYPLCSMSLLCQCSAPQ